jgi:predicted kinase
MSSKKTKLKQKPFLILIDGPMGAGKTTMAKILHTKLKRTAYLGLDRIKWYISDFKRIPRDNDISRNVLLAMIKEYLKQDINVLLDQSMKKDEIEILKELSKKYNAKCFIYQLDAPRKLLQKRVEERTRLLNKPKISKTQIERNYRIHLNNKYFHTTIFNSEKLSPEHIVKLILKEVKN